MGIHLIKDEQTNAWAMPGGKVAVYMGILPVTQDEVGLSVVMSHEVAHVLARHGEERMSQQLLTQLGGGRPGDRAFPETPANPAAVHGRL